MQPADDETPRRDLDDPHLLRSRFPILHSTTYLISNSLGAMPQEAETRLLEYARSWATRGVRAWHDSWWALPVEVGDRVAPFLGVGRGQVAMQPNVTVATAIFLSCLDYPSSRNRIVFTEHNFPSLRYLIAGEKARGAEVVVVPSRDGITVELEELLAAIDERTRVVPVSHVLFKSAYIQDAERLAKRCREVGALLLLDVYQSAGILPLALEAWGVDAAVGGCLKWLCGGPGNAFLWVRPGLDRELEPRLTGWQSHVEPFAFAPEHRRFATGAWRFLNGTPSVPALHAALPGLEILASVDLQAIRRRSLELTDHLLARAADEGFEIRSPTAHKSRGGTITVWHEQAEQLSQGLLDNDVLCDYRPNAGIRLSPHVYNTVGECDRAMDLLVELRGRL